MTEKDYQKEAWQLHLSFHQFILDSKPETLEQAKQILSEAHGMFDTLICWIEEMQKEIYRLQGEARKK